MTLNALKLSNLLLFKARGTIQGKEKTALRHVFKRWGYGVVPSESKEGARQKNI